MSLIEIPADIRSLYEIHQWRNAIAILGAVHPEEWSDIQTVLRGFRLTRADMAKKGGGKSVIATKLDGHFYRLGWQEKQFSTKIVVDETVSVSPTHKVDCFKNKVALEIEWNSKDTSYDRDLNNFRLLFDLRVIDVGVIITRSNALTPLLNEVRTRKSYQSTTHVGHLIPRLEGGGGGGCPILVLAMTREVYVEN